MIYLIGLGFAIVSGDCFNNGDMWGGIVTAVISLALLIVSEIKFK